MIMEWDSRMKNTHSVQILKAAIPFFDVTVGEKIDMEGLLSAIRPFASMKERKLIDLFLQFFQMSHMMEMMQLMQSMQSMQQEQEMGNRNPMDLLKNIIPAEHQETVDMMMCMMSAMQDNPASSNECEQEGKENGCESVDF